jgi:GNAT superfamily N-acetyltransferase
MGMKEIGIPDLPVAYPLLRRCFEESKLHDRWTADECLGWAEGMVKEKRATIFLDSIDAPTSLLFLTPGNTFFPKEKPLYVGLIYILPEHRSHAAFRKIVRIIEGQAAVNGYNAIYVSEWAWGDNPEIGPLWESLGFKKQETVFVKLLD